MVRFSLGDDDSSDDDASEPQGSPLVSPETMVLRDSNARRFPRTPSPRRATPGAKAAGEDKRRSSDLERARRAAVDAEADAAVAGLRARIRDLSTGDAAPPGETARAFEEADAAARRLQKDAARKHDAEHARLVAAAETRHAAARRRIEALAAEEARRSAEKSRRAARDAFRRAFDDAASWDDLDALSALGDGVADGAEAAALRAAEAAAARIQKHLEAARVAAAAPAPAAAAEGLDACLRELDAGAAGGLTRASEAGKMAALAVGVCRKALAQAKRAPPKPVAPPAPAPAPAAPAAAAPPAAAPAAAPPAAPPDAPPAAAAADEAGPARCFAAIAGDEWRVFGSAEACAAEKPAPLGTVSAFERAADFGCDELYRCPGAAYCDRTTGFCGIDPNAGEAFVQATLDRTVIWSFLGLVAMGVPFAVLRRIDPPHRADGPGDGGGGGAPDSPAAAPGKRAGKTR